ncbi:MAG: hypothetical protein ABIZ91_09290 [Gemmatimonadaceae bacterium]
MTIPPFTQSWADAFRDAINRDLSYREAAFGWTTPLAFVLDDGAPVGLIGPVALEMNIDQGRCMAARLISPDACTSPLVFRASYDVWRDVMEGTLDPVTAVAKGTLQLTGTMGAIVPHVRAIQALVHCARAVPTMYNDEPAA